MKFLLDTNVISEIRKRDRANANVIRWVLETPAEEIGTSVIVLAEKQGKASAPTINPGETDVVLTVSVVYAIS